MSPTFYFDVFSVILGFRDVASIGIRFTPLDIQHKVEVLRLPPPLTIRESTIDFSREIWNTYTGFIQKSVKKTPTYKWLEENRVEMFFRIDTTRILPFNPFTVSRIGIVSYVVRKEKEEVVIALFKELDRLEKEIVKNGEVIHPELPPLHTPTTVELATEVHKKIGETLEYPYCCIRNYIERWKKNLKISLDHFDRDIGAIISPHYVETPEYKLIKSTIEKKLIEHIISDETKDREFPREFYSVPYQNFYPCDLGCQKAIRIGIKYESLLEKKREFRRTLMGRVGSEVLNIIDNCRKDLSRGHISPKGLPYWLHSFLSSLKPEDENVLRGLVKEAYLPSM